MNFGANLRINRCGWCALIGIVFLIVYLRSDSSPTSMYELVSIKALLKAGIVAAERGGHAAVAARRTLTVGSKGKTLEGANDPVTSADLASNCAMVGGLRSAFPRVRIVSEESDPGSCDEQEPLSAGELRTHGDDIELLNDEFVYASDVTVWIDPLDATQEYTEQLDKYVTTMVCVAIKGLPVVGIVHFPFSARTSWGWYTKRASSDLQQKPYVASRHLEPHVVVSRSHPGTVDSYVRRALPGATVEAAGGAGYKAMRVARGEADVYLHVTAIKKWDICAGNAIINTLNGNVTTLAGKAILYTHDEVKNSDGLLVTLFDHAYYLGLIEKNQV